jgi:hypothetical protein
MSYVIYNKETTITHKNGIRAKVYLTEGSAKASLTRLVKKGVYKREDMAIADTFTFVDKIEKKVTKVNMMSGKEFEQPINTPLCCDPSSETYWCM